MTQARFQKSNDKKDMKKITTFIAALLMPMLMMAQGWPEKYEGVMLQGFYWDSFGETTWNQLTAQADELSQYFDLIWVPNSGQTKEDQWNSPGNMGYKNMGYSPVYWLRHNTCFGTEEELKTMIQTFKAKGTGIIEDVVINHKNGLTNWADFPNESVTTTSGKTYTLTWCTDMTNLWGICSNDELFTSGSPLGYHDGVQYTCSTEANADERDNFDGCRDLDHTNATVQQNIKTYLDFLVNELGYAGFRYDMVKGYAAYYVGQYNKSVNATFSVGEYWDNAAAVKQWIKDTKTYGDYQSAAFDFGLKFVINDAFGNNNWGALSDKGNAADTEINRYAVTFVDNHDTYRDANALSNNVLAANAFILAMPGTPCLFWKHWTQYKEPLKKMIEARKAAGINNQSPILEQYYQNGGYVTVVQGTKKKVLVISGYPQNVDLTGYTCVVSGDEENPNFAYYISDKEVEEPSADGITIYVNANSSNYYLYAWDQNGNYIDNAWPGTRLSTLNTTIINGKTWYYKTFDVSPLNIILNEGNNQPQTGDITGITSNQFFEYNGGTTAPNKTSENTYQEMPDGVTYEEGKVFAYFEKPSGWSDVKVWAWNDNSNFTGGTWPGVSATKVGTASNGNEIWKWVCNDNNATPSKIIFNDGSNQTANLDFINGGYYNLSGLQGVITDYTQRLNDLFNRQFTAESRSTICLPFSISESEMQNLNGKVYALASYADGYLHFNEVNKVEAFTPYVFIANTTGQLLLPFKHKIVADGTAKSVTAGDFTFIGTVAKQTLNSNSTTTYYGYKASDGSFVKIGSNGNIAPYRAYFAQPTTSNAKLSGSMFNEDISTAIFNIQPTSSDNRWYTVSGTAVEKPLRKGVYINNGKKYIVR